MSINPPPTVDDEFDHEESTKVEHSKDPEDLTAKLLLHELRVGLDRLGTFEKDLNGLRELVLQVIERNEELTQEIIALKRGPSSTWSR